MTKVTTIAAISILGLLPAFEASAAPVTFLPDQILQIAVDTSSLAGTTGSIDVQFNPGPNSVESASVAVLGFRGAKSTFDQQTGGATGGPLPNAVTITNSAVLNEDLEGLSFGSTLLFTLNFSGVAINNPGSQKPQSGSTFTLGLFSDPGATMPAAIDPSGVAFEADISASGNFTTLIESPQVSIVPEPNYLPALLLFGFGLFTLKKRWWPIAPTPMAIR